MHAYVTADGHIHKFADAQKNGEFCAINVTAVEVALDNGHGDGIFRVYVAMQSADYFNATVA